MIWLSMACMLLSFSRWKQRTVSDSSTSLRPPLSSTPGCRGGGASVTRRDAAARSRSARVRGARNLLQQLDLHRLGDHVAVHGKLRQVNAPARVHGALAVLAHHLGLHRVLLPGRRAVRPASRARGGGGGGGANACGAIEVRRAFSSKAPVFFLNSVTLLGSIRSSPQSAPSPTTRAFSDVRRVFSFLPRIWRRGGAGAMPQPAGAGCGTSPGGAGGAGAAAVDALLLF